MTKKRIADHYLTHDNWDDPEEDEVAQEGDFKRASDEVMKKRVIKKAKRKSTTDSSSTTSVNPFQSFSFGNQTTKTDISSFHFKTDTNQNSSNQLSFSFSSSTTAPTLPKQTLTNSSQSKTPQKETSNVEAHSLSNSVLFSKKSIGSEGSCSRKEEFQQLNEEVFDWIKDCITKDPSCILTPIFQDYEKYVKEIDARTGDGDFSEKKDDKKKENDQNKQTFIENKNKEENAIASTFKDPIKPVNETEQKKEDTSPVKKSEFPLFSFAPTTTTPAITSSSLFSFMPSKPDTSKPPSFSFSTSQPSTTNTTSIFSKGFFTQPTTSTPPNNPEGDAEDVPPVVESVEVKEDGAFHTVKCKLYYKLDDKFKDRGVGFLHLKPNNNKTQLIIRTDTALGNILLNINIEKNMPISRQGNNNVSMVIVPNPPVDPKKPSTNPVCALIRVKTSKDADDLHRLITEAQAKI